MNTMIKFYSVHRMIQWLMPRGAAILLLMSMFAAAAWGQPPAPDGAGAPPGGPGQSPPPDDSGPYTLSGVYTVDGGAAQTETDKTYISDSDDVSAVYVTNGGNLTLKNPVIVTSGDTSSQSNSSFFGLNAAVLATKGSALTIDGGTITTSGTGANGAISTDAESSMTLKNVTINASNDGGHGVMATQGGSLTAAVGPLFYVTNTNAVVTLRGVTATAESGTLIKASDGNWGKTAKMAVI